MFKIKNIIYFIILILTCYGCKSVGYASSVLYEEEPVSQDPPVIIKIVRPAKASNVNASAIPSVTENEILPEIVKIVVTPTDSNVTIYKEKTIQLKANAYDKDGNNILEENFKWGSMDDKTAIVDSNGLVTIIKSGKVFIKASINDVSGFALLNVTSESDSSSSSSSSDAEVKVDIIWD